MHGGLIIAHNTIKTSYQKLVACLNRFPRGAPPSEVLYKILSILFSQKEAKLVALLPIKPFTAQSASINWKMNLQDTQKILDQLADRTILVDVVVVKL